MENKHLIGAGAIGLLVLLIALFIFQSGKSPAESNAGLLNLDFTKRQGGSTRPEIKDLSAQDLKIGTSSGAVVAGDTVVVHYIGSFTDGKKFDSSYERKSPFTVEVGKGSVIKGFEQGLLGMKIGGKRRLFIPPQFGYGSVGQGDLIPPNSSLIFDVELLEIKVKDSSQVVENPVINDSTPAQEQTENNDSGSIADPTPEPPIDSPTEAPTETPAPSPSPE